MKIAKDRLYFHVPVYRLLNGLDGFLNLNLNCEIYINSDFIDGHTEKDLDLINAGFRKQEISKRVHGPFIDLNPGSSDNKIRRLCLERFLSTIELCSRFDSQSMVLHSHFEPIFYGRHFKEWLKNAEEVLGPLSTEAEKRGISIYIENSIDEDTTAVLTILESFPLFGACFDVAHHNVFNPKGWADALKEYPKGSIKEIHLSDNNGDRDSHLPLGEGSIDLEAFLDEVEKRDEDPIITVEPHSQEGMLKNIEFIKKFM